MFRFALSALLVVVTAIGCGQAGSKSGAASAGKSGDKEGQQATSKGAPPAPANGTEGERPPGPPDDAIDPIMKPVVTALEANKPEKALTLLDKVIKEQGPNHQSLFFKAQIIEGMGRDVVKEKPAEAVKKYEEALAIYKEIEDKHGKLQGFEMLAVPAAHYNLACALAIDKKPDQALEQLSTAIDKGFEEIEYAQKDEDLAEVRKLPKYEELVTRVKETRQKNLLERLAEFQPLDVSLEVTDLDGKKLSLEDMKGKVVLIDCWATWCGPCLAMLPTMKELYAQHKDDGLVILGLNFEGGPEAEGIKTVKEFMQQKPIPYPCAFAGDAVASKLPQFDGLPTWFFVGRDGKIRYQKTGAQSPYELGMIVEELLKKPAAEETK